ncbi:FBD protein [Medicago truncatula]|uniref:FBD protein n=1 Tax=Medicago truncatula TaxID=3880 RepID=G7J4Q6_MEDTR|nr:FBD protein [Medicago truncatula]
MVLASSLAKVILLCLGLIRIKVETRPEKVSHSFDAEKVLYFDSFEHPIVEFVKKASYTCKLWVGLGSNAAEEQQPLDSHHVPFYRIEQTQLNYLSHSLLSPNQRHRRHKHPLQEVETIMALCLHSRFHRPPKLHEDNISLQSCLLSHAIARATIHCQYDHSASRISQNLLLQQYKDEQNIFTCRTLTVLKINGLSIMNDIPQIMDGVYLPNHRHIINLLLSFPILEELQTNNVYVFKLPVPKTAADKIKHLPNLVTAKLSDSKAIPFFLLSKAQSLSIKLEIENRIENGNDDDEDIWEDPKIIPECLSSQLKTCLFKNYRGKKCELQFAEYVMRAVQKY